MSVVSWIAVTLSLVGIFLNARKNILCWPVWVASNVLWLIVSAVPNLNVPQTILWASFLVANFYGWINWIGDRDE